MSSASMLCRRLMVIHLLLVAVAVAVPARRAAAQAATTVFAKATVNQTSAVEGPGMISQTAAGGTFSLHQGAKVPFPPAGGENIAHVPMQPAPLQPIFPTILVNVNGTFNAFGPARPGNMMYATMAKGMFDGMPHEVTAPGAPTMQMMAGTIARARAEVTFSQVAVPGAATKYIVNSGANPTAGTPGSFAQVMLPMMPVSRGEAGTLVNDPLLFNNVPKGSVVTGGLTLQNDSMVAQVNDSAGISGIFAEGGTNLPGISPGRLGTDLDGNPLLYEFFLTFTPGGSPSSPPSLNVLFMHNDSPSVQFFDPSNPSVPLPDNMVDSTIAGRILSDPDLMLNPNGLVSLMSNLDVFTYQVTASSDVTQLQLDAIAGAGAQDGAVPAPASWLLLGLGEVFLVYCCRRRGQAAARANPPQPAHSRHGGAEGPEVCDA